MKKNKINNYGNKNNHKKKINKCNAVTLSIET